MERSRLGGSREDPYRVLGVHVGASRHEIARAYRRAVYETHPDTQPGDPCAATRFEALTAAYDLLSDPARRAAYDRMHVHPTTAAPLPRLAAQLTVSNPHLICAGPVHITPVSAPPSSPADPADSGATSASHARFVDPPVFLGRPPRPLEHWSW